MLGPASIGTVSKEHCLFQKNGGDKSPRRVLALCALSPTTLSLSFPLSLSQWPLSGLLLSALRVMPAWASSVIKAAVHLLDIHGRLDRSGEAGLYHRHPENRKCKQQHYFLDTLSSISDVCQALTRLSAAYVTVHTRFWLLWERLKNSYLPFSVFLLLLQCCIPATFTLNCFKE